MPKAISKREYTIMFETTFRNLDDTLRKDAGCSSELDYIEQTSWSAYPGYGEKLELDRRAAQ
jgi:type I restriction enzyme M protein